MIPNGCILDLTNLLLLQSPPYATPETVIIPDSHVIAAVKPNNAKYDVLKVMLNSLTKIWYYHYLNNLRRLTLGRLAK